MSKTVQISRALDSAFARFHSQEFLITDPLQCVHQAIRPEDREPVAVIAALLAYGNVTTILKSVRTVLGVLEEFGGPARVLRDWQNGKTRELCQRRLKSFVHRFTTGKDILRLLGAMAESTRVHGSVGAHFCHGLDQGNLTIEAALSGLISDWRSAYFGGHKNFLLTDPADGSCCKRWCMLLRWMGRKDLLDPGLWQVHGLKPTQLVMPLDTHTGRISQKLKLTRSRTVNWAMALEVTESLRIFDGVDPTRFDFALCRIGMLRQGL